MAGGDTCREEGAICQESGNERTWDYVDIRNSYDVDVDGSMECLAVSLLSVVRDMTLPREFGSCCRRQVR